MMELMYVTMKLSPAYSLLAMHLSYEMIAAPKIWRDKGNSKPHPHYVVKVMERAREVGVDTAVWPGLYK